MSFGRIYKITNVINGKVYIGQTIHSINHRFYLHKKNCDSPKLANAFKKYGVKNFIIEEVDQALSVEELNSKEIAWIKRLNATVTGYNIDFGGTIRHPSVGEKISKALTGKKLSPERCAALSLQRKGRPIKNYNRSEETKHKKRLSHPNSKKICDQYGNVYYSIHQAAEILNLDFRLISAVLNGKQKTTGGYSFIVVRSKP